MRVWERLRRRSGWGLCRFDASLRRIQTQEWVGFVQVWCVYEKDSDAGVGEVCAGSMLVWEGFRRRSGWGLCTLEACVRRIKTQEWVRFVQLWCSHDKDSDAGVGNVCACLCMRRIQTQECLCFVQVLCKHEKDSDAGVADVCAELVQVWEGFRRRSGWGLCRFYASMRRIPTQEWLMFVQSWCRYEKDSDTGLGEVCAGLMHAW